MGHVISNCFVVIMPFHFNIRFSKGKFNFIRSFLETLFKVLIPEIKKGSDFINQRSTLYILYILANFDLVDLELD